MSEAKRGRLWRAFGYLRPERSVVAFILVLTLGVAAVNAVEPLVLKLVFDGLTGEDPTRALGVGVVALLGCALGKELLGAVSNWLTWRTRLRVHFALMRETVDRLHRLPVTYHRREGVGAVMTRLERGVQGFVNALNEVAFKVVPTLLFLAVSLVLMLQLDWRLSLAVLAFVPVPALIGVWVAPVQTRRQRTLMDRWATIYSRFNEVLSGILTVKSFSMEDVEKRRFLRDVHDANRIVVRGVGLDSGVGAAQNLCVLLARVAAIGLGGYLILQGEATVGTLVAFLGYIGGLFGPVQGLTGVYQTLRTASVCLDEVFDILDAHDPLQDAPDAEELSKVRGDVRFEGVRYACGGPNGRPLIDRVDLHVRPGETVALVGPSGAGKTTLMALLQRFYDPDAGTIRVDGRDLRRLKQASLRQHIGVVMQDALLFNESVAANIAYGRPEATREEVVAAARAAHAHEFIEELEGGYEYSVGERGNKLSAGQRQRIAIARALLKDPAILILDEPTSALDAESEALVQEALERLMRGRTTFVVAHRLSTIVHANRILVLRGGQIVEAGRHQQLVEEDGYYAQLVRHQTRGLVPAGS